MQPSNEYSKPSEQYEIKRPENYPDQYAQPYPQTYPQTYPQPYPQGTPYNPNGQPIPMGVPMGYPQHPEPYIQYQNFQQAPPPQQTLHAYTLPGTAQAIPAIFIPKSGMEKLMVPGIFVKQKIELWEVLCGCETENRYTVYACGVDGRKTGAPLFKCREKSNICNRLCLPGDCRNFKMSVTHESGGAVPGDGREFLKLKRPFACTFLCWNRPYIEVNLEEGQQSIYLGRVIHEFSLCEMKFVILNQENVPIYSIKATYWQIGVHNSNGNIGACCASCQQAFLFIYDLRQNEKRVGLIEKRGRGFVEMISDADNFSVLFPISASSEERTLILAACLLLDFRYFERMDTNRRNIY